MVQEWLQRLGLTVNRTDTAPAPAKSAHVQHMPPGKTPRWLDRATRGTPVDGVTSPAPMTQAELDAACDWLNNPRGWRRLR
jgi:hypothetical protein